MMRLAIALLLLLPAVRVLAQFKNKKIAQAQGTDKISASVTISPKDPQNIVIGLKGRVLYSTDEGRSWSETKLSSAFGMEGTPALISDAKGGHYFVHLSDPDGGGKEKEGWHDRIISHNSSDKGVSWSEGTFFGENPPKDQFMVGLGVHPRKQYIYATWTQADQFGLNDANCQSNILFSMSTSEGKKWSKPYQVSQNAGGCTEEKSIGTSMPVIDEEGRVCIAWANQNTIYFDRSFDGGTTWLTNDLVISTHESAWSYEVPGAGTNRISPILLMDNSKNRLHGSVFLLWADQTSGEEDTDVWFIRTNSRGDMWTQTSKVTKREPGKHQFMPAAAIDQATGYLYVMYYDRGSYSDMQTDVYLAYSIDGGSSFKEVKISDTPFTPAATGLAGVRTSIAAYGGIIVPVWTRDDGGQQSIWTAVINQKDLLKEPSKK